MTTPLDVSPQQFMNIRLGSICQEFANNGAARLLVGFLPDMQIIQINGNHQAGTKEYADQLELLAKKLLEHAKQSVPMLKSTLIIPQ